MPGTTFSLRDRLESFVPFTAPLATSAFLLVLSACGSEAAAPSTFSSRDSAGIVIAENAGEPPSGENAWKISSEPILQIGTMEGDDAYMFQRIWGATRLSDGRIAVVDNGAAEVRTFSGTGEHLRTFGRKGEGPGEFNSPVLVGALAGDTLVVVDRILRRINLFDPDEGFVRSATADMEIQGYLFPVGMFTSGTTLAERTQWTEEMPNGLFRFPIRYRTVALDGSLATDFGEFPGNETIFATQAMGSGAAVMSTNRPFGKTPSASVGGDLFFYSSQDTYEIQVRNEQGTLVRLIRRDKEPRAVSDDDIAELMEQFADENDDDDQRRQFRRMIREAPLPEVFPALGPMYADNLGYLWVEEVQAPGDETRWATVFDPEGRMVGSVIIPDRFRVLEIGADYVLGRWVDNLGVNYLRLYELKRPG